MTFQNADIRELYTILIKSSIQIIVKITPKSMLQFANQEQITLKITAYTHTLCANVNLENYWRYK